MSRSGRGSWVLRLSACALFALWAGACERATLVAQGPISIDATPREIAFLEPVQSPGMLPELCFEFHPPGGSRQTSEIRVALITTSGARESWLTTTADRRGEATVCLRQAGNLTAAGADPSRTYRGVELSANVPLSVRQIRWVTAK